MKHWIVASALVFGATVFAALPSSEKPGLTYEVSALRGKLMREEPVPTERLGLGNTVPAGAVLRTGWWASAELTCSTKGAHFRLEPSTRVRLTDNVPGVLLDLEKGNVRAWFDPLVGESPSERLVTTPSAVLAVKGTEYGVSVSDDGDTTIIVFSGVVEVLDLNRNQGRVMLQAGMYCTVPRGQGPTTPVPHGMRSGDFDLGVMPGKSGNSSTAPGMGTNTQNYGSNSGSQSGSRARGPMGGGKRP